MKFILRMQNYKKKLRNSKRKVKKYIILYIYNDKCQKLQFLDN